MAACDGVLKTEAEVTVSYTRRWVSTPVSRPQTRRTPEAAALIIVCPLKVKTKRYSFINYIKLKWYQVVEFSCFYTAFDIFLK